MIPRPRKSQESIDSPTSPASASNDKHPDRYQARHVAPPGAVGRRVVGVVECTGLALASGMATVVVGNAIQGAVGPVGGVARAESGLPVVDLHTVESMKGVPPIIAEAAEMTVTVSGAGGTGSGVRMNADTVVYPISVHVGLSRVPCGPVQLYVSDTKGGITVEKGIDPVQDPKRMLALATSDVPSPQSPVDIPVISPELHAGELVYIAYRHRSNKPLDRPIVQPAVAVGGTHAPDVMYSLLTVDQDNTPAPAGDESQVDNYRGGAVINGQGSLVGVVAYDAPLPPAEVEAVNIRTDASVIRTAVVQPVGTEVLGGMINAGSQMPRPDTVC